MKPLALAALTLLLASCSRPAPEQVSTEQPASPAAEVPAPAPTQPAIASDRTAMVGTWQLLSFEQNETDGSITHPYGDMPIGRLTFDNAGRMSVFVMKPGRFASVNSTSAIPRATVDDLRQIADGFIAYYGAFQVDEEAKTLTTKVEAATIPAWADSEQKRTYELADGTLTLITPATRLTWMRLPN